MGDVTAPLGEKKKKKVLCEIKAETISSNTGGERGRNYLS